MLCLAACLTSGLSAARDEPAPPARSLIADDGAGSVWTGRPGITETIAAIMEREALQAGTSEPPEVPEPALGRLLPPSQNPDAPPIAQWPPPDAAPGRRKGVETTPGVEASPGVETTPGTPAGPLGGFESVFLPQPVATNFKTISLRFPLESGFVPPDSVGDVGPTQILAMANGRIKVFDRNGVVGGLNASANTFFASVRGTAGVSDPQVRYDRLSGRWFVTIITVDLPNKVLIAVSSGPIITGTSSFTFFAFQHDLVGVTPNPDTDGFADYDSLGVDRFALYIGVNIFNSSLTALLGATGYVVNKADLIAGTLTVTPFRQIANAFGSGLFAPRGVSNDDPAATEGYFVGADVASFSQIVIRRISNPDGVPAISPPYTLIVPTTTMPRGQVAQGIVGGGRLDALDDRLFSAVVRRNKITGESGLFTAHNIEVDATGVGVTGGGRNGSRWYEIGNLTTTPTLTQAGTLFDPAGIEPRGFWIPSVSSSGQGHMAIGCSYASAHDFAGVATAGRLRSDPAGTTRAATLAQASSTAYNAQGTSPQRWGDYSHTVVDPNDDMTLWTFQEWCDGTDSWGVQAIQLKAPPPATPASATPASVCAGMASVTVTISGTTTAGSEFFDPGPDTGGPGYPNHLGASVSGGVVVTGVAFTDPTHLALTLSTLGAAGGPRTITITNPDGQTAAGPGALSIGPFPAPAASADGPVCVGGTLQLSASSFPGATYSWTGPNGFTSSQQNPVLAGVTAAASGTYSVTYAASGCASVAATVPVTVIGEGAACSDGDACTLTDACHSGLCVGSNPVSCPAAGQCSNASVCDPATGICSAITPKPEGGGCDDGAGCTAGDACHSGVCVSALGFGVPAGSPFPAGELPFSIATADFNRDGKPDLAVANSQSGDVTLLLGNGAGQLAPAPGSPVPTGLTPTSVAVGDFNRDGKPDLAVANSGEGSVTILLGDGAGGLAPAPGSPVGAGAAPFGVAVADLNLDLKPDLAVADSGGDVVTILLGNGAGGFAAAAGSPVAVGSTPSALAPGDVNLDGKPDLVVTNYGSANLSILLGNGSGGFAPAVGSPLGSDPGPFPVLVADLNLDQKPDLAVANTDAGDLVVYLGDGAGGFQAVAPIGVGVNPYAVATADFNRDGRPDLAVANSGSGDVTVLLGDATGRFGPPAGTPVAAGTSLSSIAVGDFDLDGRPDLAVSEQASNSVIVLLDLPATAPDGTGCSDGNACTSPDACLGGVCHAGPATDADADGHPATLCGGDDCNDADEQVWRAPLEVTGVMVTTATPASIAWDDQGALVGPGTTYDLVSGPLAIGSNGFAAAVCLQSAGPASFSDARPAPGANAGYWYLARGRNGCGTGTYGSSLRDASIPPCP